MLCFPAEATDAALAGRAIDNECGAAADAITIAIERVLQRQQCLVRNRFDQPGAKHRNWHAAHDDRRVGWNHWLAGMARDGEQVEQRFAGCVERNEFAAWSAAPG